jgi:hypothetical protein
LGIRDDFFPQCGFTNEHEAKFLFFLFHMFHGEPRVSAEELSKLLLINVNVQFFNE